MQRPAVMAGNTATEAVSVAEASGPMRFALCPGSDTTFRGRNDRAGSIPARHTSMQRQFIG